ncbi:MAG TPA: GGDEF domain-containing protein [Polyangia bacterium]|nr:GGDEF domain-containing protein [Polyangia bacterium]
MKLAMVNKQRTEPRGEDELEARLVRLSRQNAVLRKEIARLQVYRAMAYRDPLTGMWNRRYFEERLREEFSRSQRAGAGRKFSVLMIDINHFKEINDQHGHPAGDAMLRWVGEFLTAHLRTHDVACRTGGDEFAVLLPDLSGEDCGRILGRLRDALTTANRDREIPISLSLGTASWPDVTTSAEALLAQADEAMYADKRRQKSEMGIETEPSDRRITGARSATAA